MNKLELLQPLFFDDYLKNQKITLVKHFNKIKKNQIPFGYSIESSAVYSSMIEGNIMDFDTYLKYAHSGMNNKSKSFTEIEDLKNAYLFAKTNAITFDNFLESPKNAEQRTIVDVVVIKMIKGLRAASSLLERRKGGEADRGCE